MRPNSPMPRHFALTLAAGGAAAALLGLALRRRAHDRDLAGQVALVTGGSRGLGLLIARELGRAGSRVAVCARDAEELEAARRWLRGEGVEAHTEVCDVTRQEDVERMFARARDRLGPVDVLVNNAGVMQVAPLETLSLDDFRSAHAVMFWGTLRCTLAALPDMLARRSGRIVDITSIGGVVTVPHLLPYSTAKAAAVALSEGLGIELAGKGVSVTTVIPWTMRTGSHLAAAFRGDAAKEYAWFSLGATLPLASVSAARAARAVVAAARQRRARLVIGLPAKLVALAHGVFPTLTDAALAGMNALLPSAPPPERRPSRPLSGAEAEAARPSAVLKSLTGLGHAAAKNYQHRVEP